MEGSLDLRISLTERLSVEANGASLDERRFPGRQGRIVFAYLAAAQGRAVPRDELAEVLWGEDLPATWEKALRVLMTKLRALLEECGLDGSAALTSAFGCYKLTLPAGAWIDVDAAVQALESAEAALAAGEFAAARSEATTAAALARRSFLPGEDGSWVEGRRRDLRDVLVRSLECLRDTALEGGEFADAVRHGEEVIELEPFRESGYRRLMQAHISAGNPAEALRVYERCRRFLADELGAYPSPETEAVYLELLREDRVGTNEDGVPVVDAPGGTRSRRRSGVLLVVALLVAAVGAGILQLVQGDEGDASPLELAGSAVVTLAPGSGAREATVSTPASPTAMAAGLGFVWSASADTNTVVVLDPATNTVRDTIAVESVPGGIAISGSWVWVTNSLTGTVSRISPQTFSVVQTIPVGNGPTGIAAGDGDVWVANTSDNTVTRLRAEDGRVLDTFAAGDDPGAIALGEGAVWVASKLTASVLKLSPETGALLDRIPVGDGPVAIAVGSGSVWVANSLSGTVSRLDPTTGDVRGTFEIGSTADAVTAARGQIWVASASTGDVVRIDGRTGKLTPVHVGGRPSALAARAATVYVGLRPSGTAHVGGSLRVLVSNPGPPAIDTATAYSPEAWRTLVLTNDGLVSWRRVGGQAGTDLVPDLAVSLPTVSGDGLTYTFQLRPNLRYSDGRELAARDVRYSIERLYKLGPRREPAALESYRAIVGADRCREQPARCDLSEGIVTDDRQRTVTFHLVTPDPEFLSKLALPFAYVVPAGTSLREAVRRPLPATGPYRIAGLSSSGSLRLVRNPRFREWSSAAQPAGFADEIVIRPIASAVRRARLVAQGKADYASATEGEPLGVPPADRPRFHVRPLPATFYLMLDTTRPPFDALDARRAANFGLDRERVIRLGGSAATARPTCQVLPPNFPGYRPYCPYSLGSKPASPWKAPDRARARRLVKASGTGGAEVELWWHRNFGAPVGRYLVRELDALGFRARLRLFSGDLGKYFSALEQPRASWHLAGNGWFADYPAASNFINLLACSSPYNTGRFCNRAIDRKVRQALRIQRRDPASANARWAALDRELTDQAPWVFLSTLYSGDFVSKRVGNYQHHPLWGPLLDQLWVQ
jgi:YVTN family beta-propeller protein